MDKNLDFEKLIEQARFLSQLMNTAGGAKPEESYGPDGSSDTGAEYTGAFSSNNGDIPAPDTSDSQEIIEKALQAVKLFQAFNQNEQTSDGHPAYDNTSVHNDFTDDSLFTEEAPEDDGRRSEEANTDFSRYYDETFSTPTIKALKSAIRFVDPRYRKTLSLWIKFLEMQNMMQLYEKKAAEGYGQPAYADWRRGLLMSVRPYIGRDKQYTIDFLIKIIELKEIIAMMEEVGDGG